MTHSGVGLVIVAAGTSTRMGGVDKLWTDLCGSPLIAYSLRALVPHAERTVIVVHTSRLAEAQSLVASYFLGAKCIAGGRDRRESVRLGIEKLGLIDRVAIHDGARPFATWEMVRSGLEILDKCQGAVPVLPVTDTVKQVDQHGEVVHTLDRASLRAAQTPQIYHLEALRLAHAQPPTITTDDAMLLERAGLTVGTFPGASKNFKVTTPFDLEMATCLLARTPL